MERSEYRQKSFWMATTEYRENPPLEGTAKVDVAIIGGGFSGMSSAYHIKQADPGAEVAVLEAQVTGYGASGRSGGFSMTLFGLSLDTTYMLYGEVRTREAFQYMVEAVEYVDELIRKHNLQCDYQRSGFLRVATNRAQVKRIHRELELAAKIGLSGVMWWERDQVQEAVHSERLLGGWWEPRCALLHPAKFVRELKRIAEEAGAVIYERSPVLEIRRTTQGFLLKTPTGEVHADKVVFATNAWSHLFPWLRRKQVPVWTYQVATEPLSPEMWRTVGWEQRMGIEDARNLIHYFRPSPDGRILMGGGHVILSYGRNMEKDLDEPTFQHLEGFLKTLFPPLKGVRIAYRWGGPVSVTLDMAPAVGTAHDREVVYNLGCIGHGVSLMPSNGRIIADLVLERKTSLTDLWFVNRRVLPVPGEPLRSLLTHAIRGFFILEDWWHECRRGAS
ncbi:MAG: FAD-dependent oxidoreductase [Armatimonadota bacterium]|nr:FAD-dependent oxidoreductase [Armatimonadota bacterium]